MICNGFILREIANSHKYIEIVNPDWYDENTWENFWCNLISSLKDIIPQWELIADYFFYTFNNNISNDDRKAFLEKINTLEESSEYIYVQTIYGKIRVNIYNVEDTILRYGKPLLTNIVSDDNDKLIVKIAGLLENSKYFTKLEEYQKY